MDIVSSTYARNNLSKLLDKVVSEGKKIILFRDSVPQAVLVPYAEVAEQEENWQKEFQALSTKTKTSFKSYLKKTKAPKKKLKEEEVYEIINKTAGRN
jgi:prevent-host-death family protein